MRRGNLVLIGVASAIATLVSLNVIFGSSWNYYGRYGYHGHYCNERYHREANRNNQRNQDDHDRDSTGNY